MPVEVKRSGADDAPLLYGGDGFGCTGQAAASAVSHLEENQHVTVPADEVNFAPATEHVACQNSDASRLKVARGNALGMVPGGFSSSCAAIHGIRCPGC